MGSTIFRVFILGVALVALGLGLLYPPGSAERFVSADITIFCGGIILGISLANRLSTR